MGDLKGKKMYLLLFIILGSTLICLLSFILFSFFMHDRVAFFLYSPFVAIFVGSNIIFFFPF